MDTTTSTEDSYQAAAARFEKRNIRSKQLYEQACKSLPGGNVRTVLYYHPFPLSIESGHDAIVTDVDGHQYVDMLGEYTAGLYGHSNPIIKRAIVDAVERGLSLGGHGENEHKLASLIEQRIPSIELLRFTNSGTEANLMNLALATAHTGKKKVIVFNGGYHGGVFSWKGGVGSPINAPHQFLVAKFNDIESVKRLADDPSNADHLACIIVEPMIGSGGGMPASLDFLKELRHIADKHKALLIFDEVMSSRLFSGGGYQSQLSVEYHPDLTSLGKYIGGGMSFGAFGGKRSLMARFDPSQSDSLAHAGTFNNNVLTMAAGVAGLQHVFTAEAAEKLHKTGDDLRRRVQKVSQGTLLQWTGCGSILCIHFTSTVADKIHAPEDVANADRTLSDLFHLIMLEEGFYVGRRGFIALSLALTSEQLDSFVAAVQRFIDTFKPYVALN